MGSPLRRAIGQASGVRSVFRRVLTDPDIVTAMDGFDLPVTVTGRGGESQM